MILHAQWNGMSTGSSKVTGQRLANSQSKINETLELRRERCVEGKH